MLSFSYKWLNENKVHNKALPDYPGYDKHKEDDRALVKDLWDLFNTADIIIAHNADKFDVKKSQARFIVHGLAPPKPYKTIDTLKIARKHFAFTSNKLDDLGAYFNVGRKLEGFGDKREMWLKCMSGDRAAWKRMIDYNNQDTLLLERVYLKLRAWYTPVPWTSVHPDLGSYTHTSTCPTCNSHKIQKRGHNVTKTGVRDRFQCMDCGAWSSGIKHKRVGRL
jgi:hypothetical protein